MSQLFKFAAATGLVLAGFCAASLLGPPEHLASRLERADADRTAGELEPINAPRLTPGNESSHLDLADDGVTPAGFNTGQSAGFVAEVRAAHYPESPSADRPWGAASTPETPRGLSIPELRRQDNPAETLGTAAEAQLATLGPPPKLGEFSPPATEPASASPSAFAETASSPPPTFAQRPQSDNSPWNDHAQPAQPSAPLPWATGTGSAPVERAPTALRTPATHAPADWEETRPTNAIRWHVVADGDSLPRLAERYLNDPSRGQEIFEENRNVLKDPDVLPIGLELRIPSATVSQKASVRVYDAQGEVHSGIQQRQLVRLPEVSPSAATAPVARLRAPQSPGAYSADGR